MKKYYLYNILMLLFAFIIFMFFRNQGFFVSLIMKNDIIFYAAVLPVYLLVGVFGLSYQFFGIKKNDENLLMKISSILVTFYLMLVLILQTRIYVTTGDGLLIVILAIPASLILINITFTFLNRKIISA